MTLGTSFKEFLEQPDCEFESFMLAATTKHAKESLMLRLNLKSRWEENV